MSVTATPAQTASSPSPRVPWAELDASCCAPVLGLFGNGLLWLLVASFFGLIASLKFHNAHFLAGESAWSYGRVHAASASALLYGFAVPTALGVGLWLLTRLGRAPLAAQAVIFVGMIIWNLAVAVGLLAILCGGMTGYEAFQMPHYAVVLLIIGYLLMAIGALLTFHRREPGDLYPSQWFAVGSILWFPWIFTTAAALLLRMPVRGVMQASLSWWYANNLSYIVLGFAGLAAIFYFIPKLINRPLHSSHLAGFSLFFLALFGSWGGVPSGAPLPAWMVGLSVVGTILTTVPVIAVGVNLYQTAKKDLHKLDHNVTLQFTYVAIIFWLVANAQRIVGAFPDVSSITDYTWYSVAQWNLFHYGFFAFAIFGAMYYIIPRLLASGDTLPAWSPKLVKFHFWLTLLGVLISYVALLVGGIGQGYSLSKPSFSFTEVMAGTLTPLRASTLGDLMILVGTILFVLNLTVLLSNVYCRRVIDTAVALQKEQS